MLPCKIQGNSITLAPLTKGHVDKGYFEWINDTEITRYLEARYKTWSRDELRLYISDCNQDNKNYLFGIFDKDKNYIGNIKLGPLINKDERASIGLMIGDKNSWGKGYGLEAVKLVVQFAFDDLNLKKITAGCYGSHIASKILFTKAGFEIEGCLKSHIATENGREDQLLFGLVNMGAKGCRIK